MKTLITISLFFLINLPAFAQQDSLHYSFFTAGHAYGNPVNFHYGLHPPFADFIPTLNSDSTIDFGVFTGDVVRQPAQKYWDSALVDLSRLEKPYYIAAGNHDVGPAFASYFPYYQDFLYNQDLFIILTPSLDQWNISGDQLSFLQSSLHKHQDEVNHIFIFLHELIWWSPENKYRHIKINHVPHYPGPNNFDAEVLPLLRSIPRPITIYAGDLGATWNTSAWMFHQFENITFIGSGMGDGARDNIIVTEVFQDSVHYKLVSLNCEDPNCLGELPPTPFQEPTWTYEGDLGVFPVPAQGHFFIENGSESAENVEIWDGMGKLVWFDEIDSGERRKIYTSKLGAGLFWVKMRAEERLVLKKLVISR